MITVIEIISIIVLFAVFGFSHSLLASKVTKEFIRKRFGNKIAFYRLGYNIVSILVFLLVWEFVPHPDIVVYDFPYPYDIIIFILQTLSLFGIIWAVSVVELGEFIGIAQIQRYYLGIYNEKELDEKSTFHIRGAYRISRHPIYFFFILFLGFRPTMDLFYITAYFCFVVYFYLGSVYEEKKLLEKFGEKYALYQQIVPRIIPYKLFGNKKLEKLNEF